MDYTTSTPRHDIQISGVKLSVIAPYGEGHVLLANEAAVLNQTLAENFRNNFAGVIAKAKDAKGEGYVFSDEDKAEFQSQIDAYMATYAFGVRRTGTPKIVDPVEREAVRIATEAVRAALAKKGIKVAKADVVEVPAGSITKANFDALVEKHAASDAVKKEANRRVKATGNVGLDDLGI